jgi:ABC-type multidrug transport system permease subunit
MTSRSAFAALAAVVHRESRIRATNATFIFWDLLSPLAYLLVFGVGIDAALGPPAATGGVDYNAFFLGGVLGMASFTIASNTAWSFFMDRDNGIFYEMLTYPLTRSQYLLGKVLFNVGVALVQAAVAVGLGALLLDIPIVWTHVPLLVAAVVVGTAGWFFFYAIFALSIRRNDAFNTVTSIFYFVFLFASSMFYPLDPLPHWFRVVALANPITWHVDVLRFATIGLGAPATLVWQSIAFTAFSLACFVAATRILDRQE